METNSKIQQRRKVLISLSNKALKIVETMAKQAQSDNEAMYWSSRTINQILMFCLYDKEGKRIFKTFNAWKREGKNIAKGAKAVMVWGQPIGTHKRDKKQEGRAETEPTADEMQYYPIAFLFSNEQTS